MNQELISTLDDTSDSQQVLVIDADVFNIIKEWNLSNENQILCLLQSKYIISFIFCSKVRLEMC